MRRPPGASAWPLVLAALVLAAALPAVGATTHRVPTGPGQVVAAAAHPFASSAPTVVTAQVPLLEVFTATWCPPCAPADRAIERLLGEREGNASAGLDLVVLAYHPWPDPGAEDPFGVPEGMARMQRKYGATWFPSTYVAGNLRDTPDSFGDVSVDAGMEQLFYASYRGLVERGAAVPPVFHVTLGASLEGRNATVDVRLEAVSEVWDDLFIQAALWEDEVFFPGTNGVDTHRMVVRALGDRDTIAGGVAPGDVWEGAWTFAVPEEVGLAKAGVTLFVETGWGRSGRAEADDMMVFAGGVAAAAMAASAWLARPGARRQRP